MTSTRLGTTRATVEPGEDSGLYTYEHTRKSASAQLAVSQSVHSVYLMPLLPIEEPLQLFKAFIFNRDAKPCQRPLFSISYTDPKTFKVGIDNEVIYVLYGCLCSYRDYQSHHTKQRHTSITTSMNKDFYVLL